MNPTLIGREEQIAFLDRAWADPATNFVQVIAAGIDDQTSCVVAQSPDFFGNPDNYIPANPLVTPPDIVPEWYLLPFYAMLRSVPQKLIGVIVLFVIMLQTLADTD